MERPASVHMRHRTTVKFRILTVILSVAIIPAGFYLAWLAFKILEPTPFNRIGLFILSASSIGVVMWFLLITVMRRSFRRKIEDLRKYRVEHGIGVRPEHRKKTLPLRYHKQR
ncbi:MAG: hypothetical protein V1839_00120 [archaeon]